MKRYVMIALLCCGCGSEPEKPEPIAEPVAPPEWNELAAVDALIHQAEAATTKNEAEKMTGLIQQLRAAAEELKPERARDPFTFKFHLDDLKAKLTELSQASTEDQPGQLKTIHASVDLMLKSAGLSHAGHAH